MVNCPGRGLRLSQMIPPKGGVVSLYRAGDFSRCRLTGGHMWLATGQETRWGELTHKEHRCIQLDHSKEKLNVLTGSYIAKKDRSSKVCNWDVLRPC